MYCNTRAAETLQLSNSHKAASTPQRPRSTWCFAGSPRALRPTNETKRSEPRRKTISVKTLTLS